MQYWAEHVKSANVPLGIVASNNHYAGFGPGTANVFRKMLGMEAMIWSDKGQSTLPLCICCCCRSCIWAIEFCHPLIVALGSTSPCYLITQVNMTIAAAAAPIETIVMRARTFDAFLFVLPPSTFLLFAIR